MVAASSNRLGIGERPCSPLAATAISARRFTSCQSAASEVMSVASTSLETPAASVRMISAQSGGATSAPTDLTYARAAPASLRLT